MEVLRQINRQANTILPINRFRDVPDAVIIEDTASIVSSIGTLEKRSPFIEANTSGITLPELRGDFIPVFAKDNESTISHLEFVEVIYSALSMVFPKETLSGVECRVSHKVCGRIPSAVGKPANQLEDWEKTQYYERFAFGIEVKSITDVISGNELTLSIVGVRSYNHTNLYGKKGFEMFKLAIGFCNQVCTNMCINSDDGLASEIQVFNIKDLQMKALDLFQNYNIGKHLAVMKQLPEMAITESQFASLLGRTRLYQYLPKRQQKQLPQLAFGDSHLNSIARDYYHDQRFCKSDDGYLNLYNLHNLFTNANRNSSYIDTFLDRAGNATDFVNGIASALKGDESYQWFLS
jgi:hypothetical protein